MKKLFRASVFILISLFIGCSSDDDNNQAPGDDDTVLDLEAAKLIDFKLSEVNDADTDVDMIQPEIVDGEVKKHGQIVITIPATADNLNLSLASVNFDESKFEISPAVGSVQAFEIGSTILYTITSKIDPEKSIRYLVTVLKEVTQPKDKLKINGFRFEKSKNSFLTLDIEATKIETYANYINVIYVLVPLGTDLKELVPTIDFEGGTLEYKQGNNDYEEYPTAGLKVDFTSKYNIMYVDDNNEFLLSVKDAETRKNYRVIVDVENPIELKESTITTSDVVEGDTRNFSFEFINKGNHVIESKMEASGYVDKTSDNKGNIFSAYVEVSDLTQGSLIKPGEKGRVVVTVNANGAAVGNYDVDIVFSPKYKVFHARINDTREDLNPVGDIFPSTKLNVKTKVISN